MRWGGCCGDCSLLCKMVWWTQQIDFFVPVTFSRTPRRSSAPISETRDDLGRGQEQGSQFLTRAHAELRRGVRGVCARFPNEYWRELDARRRYPEEFVRAMSEAGYLAALVP
jgi:hypothetical protein